MDMFPTQGVNNNRGLAGSTCDQIVGQSSFGSAVFNLISIDRIVVIKLMDIVRIGPSCAPEAPDGP